MLTGHFHKVTPAVSSWARQPTLPSFCRRAHGRPHAALHCAAGRGLGGRLPLCRKNPARGALLASELFRAGPAARRQRGVARLDQEPRRRQARTAGNHLHGAVLRSVWFSAAPTWPPPCAACCPAAGAATGGGTRAARALQAPSRAWTQVRGGLAWLLPCRCPAGTVQLLVCCTSKRAPFCPPAPARRLRRPSSGQGAGLPPGAGAQPHLLPQPGCLQPGWGLGAGPGGAQWAQVPLARSFCSCANSPCHLRRARASQRAPAGRSWQASSWRPAPAARPPTAATS